MFEVFVCQLDQKTFSSENELMQHMLQEHTTKHSVDERMEKSVLALKEAFPFAEVSAEKAENRNHGDWLFNMNWAEKEMEFQFYIGYALETDFYHRQFDTVEKSIRFYQSLLQIEKEGIEILQEKFQPEEIRIDQIWERERFRDAFISFEIIKNGNSYFERFEVGETKEKFARKMDGYFDRTITGELTISRYASKLSGPEYLLDGVPVRNLLERGKKLRIEILEERRR